MDLSGANSMTAVACAASVLARTKLVRASGSCIVPMLCTDMPLGSTTSRMLATLHAMQRDISRKHVHIHPRLSMECGSFLTNNYYITWSSTKADRRDEQRQMMDASSAGKSSCLAASRRAIRFFGSKCRIALRLARSNQLYTSCEFNEVTATS